MSVNADIFVEREDWRHPLALSVAFHGFLFAVIFLYAFVFGGVRGTDWGGTGGGGAMSARLVGNVPLPAGPVETQNIVANESKGVSKTLPAAKETPAPDAIPIPARNAKKGRETTTGRTSVGRPALPNLPPVPEEPEVVPFGQGGPVSGPYGVFSASGAKGGLSFTGGAGDFGTRYAWYVDVVRRKLSETWTTYGVPGSVTSANRVYITFEIDRAGRPSSPQIEQSSGVPVLDQAAIYTVRRIDTFGPLPADYSGSKVNVEFWFDYRK